ncbi:hypothetical protein [Actinokineospora sp.]|uniref:hypothetical protein n=1 Tax=Actinokineospora sp. TaxID=1872133 RepID=UPI0040381CB9
MAKRGSVCARHRCWALFWRRDPTTTTRRQRTSAGPGRRPPAGSAHQVGLSVANAVWQRTITRRASYAVDAATWSALCAADAAKTCAVFARLARDLGTAQDQAQALTQRLLGAATKTNATVARIVAEQVTKRLFEVAGPHLSGVVNSLRVLGLFVCVGAGRDPGDCRCLKDMLAEHGKDEVKSMLKDGLAELIGSR